MNGGEVASFINGFCGCRRSDNRCTSSPLKRVAAEPAVIVSHQPRLDVICMTRVDAVVRAADHKLLGYRSVHPSRTSGRTGRSAFIEAVWLNLDHWPEVCRVQAAISK